MKTLSLLLLLGLFDEGKLEQTLNKTYSTLSEFGELLEQSPVQGILRELEERDWEPGYIDLLMLGDSFT